MIRAACATWRWPRTRTLITVRPSRTAASYQAKSGAWSAQENSTIRYRRPASPRRRPLASTTEASSGPLNVSIADEFTPAAISRPTPVPIDRDRAPPRARLRSTATSARRRQLALDERLDLADQPLEGLVVVRRRLLRDDRVEAELDVRREPLRELRRRAVPERRVV